MPNPNWEGGRPPFPSSLSPPSFLSYSYLEGGNPTPLGRAIERAGPPPPPLLYIRGGGHPLETQQLIIDLLAVCGAPLHHNPPRSYRRSA